MNEVKKKLCNPPVFEQFALEYKTMLQTDASRLKGLRFALVQKHEDCWKLIECDSGFIETEERYSITEMEMLASVWATRKCHIYLLGKPFIIQTDHNPLTSIIDKQGMNGIANPRLQKMREKILVYKFTT